LDALFAEYTPEHHAALAEAVMTASRTRGPLSAASKAKRQLFYAERRIEAQLRRQIAANEAVSAAETSRKHGRPEGVVPDYRYGGGDGWRSAWNRGDDPEWYDDIVGESESDNEVIGDLEEKPPATGAPDVDMAGYDSDEWNQSPAPIYYASPMPPGWHHPTGTEPAGNNDRALVPWYVPLIKRGNFVGPYWNNGKYQTSQFETWARPIDYGDWRSAWHDYETYNGVDLTGVDLDYAYDMILQGADAYEIVMNTIAGIAVGTQGILRVVGVIPNSNAPVVKQLPNVVKQLPKVVEVGVVADGPVSMESLVDRKKKVQKVNVFKPF